MNNIPKVFWYVLSLCMFMLTIVISYAAIKSTKISIEHSNTKIEIANEKASLISNATDLTKFKNELKLINERLKIKQAVLASYTEKNEAFKYNVPDFVKDNDIIWNSKGVSPLSFSDIEKSLDMINPKIIDK